MSTRNYSGPTYPNEINTVADLNKAMKWLVQEKPLPGARKGNSPCNGGETIEAALNQEPSIKKIDFKLKDGQVELKSGRQKIGKSPDTLATRTLDSWTTKPFSGKTRTERYEEFVHRFSYRGKMKIENISGSYYRSNLHIELSPEPNEKTKLYLKLDKDDNKIWICYGSGKMEEMLMFYDETDVLFLMEKMRLQYYVKIEEKALANGQFEYDVKGVDARVFKLGNLNTKSLFDAIKSGKLVLELRAHICNNTFCKDSKCSAWKKRGSGRLRCHGTAIRIVQSKISDVFEIREVA